MRDESRVAGVTCLVTSFVIVFLTTFDGANGAAITGGAANGAGPTDELQRRVDCDEDFFIHPIHGLTRCHVVCARNRTKPTQISFCDLNCVGYRQSCQPTLTTLSPQPVVAELRPSLSPSDLLSGQNRAGQIQIDSPSNQRAATSSAESSSKQRAATSSDESLSNQRTVTSSNESLSNQRAASSSAAAGSAILASTTPVAKLVNSEDETEGLRGRSDREVELGVWGIVLVALTITILIMVAISVVYVYLKLRAGTKNAECHTSTKKPVQEKCSGEELRPVLNQSSHDVISVVACVVPVFVSDISASQDEHERNDTLSLREDSVADN